MAVTFYERWTTVRTWTIYCNFFSKWWNTDDHEECFVSVILDIFLTLALCPASPPLMISVCKKLTHYMQFFTAKIPHTQRDNNHKDFTAKLSVRSMPTQNYSCNPCDFCNSLWFYFVPLLQKKFMPVTNWFSYTIRIRWNWLVMTVNFLILHAVTAHNSQSQCDESINCVFQIYIIGAQPLAPVTLILKNDLSHWPQMEHEW